MEKIKHWIKKNKFNLFFAIIFISALLLNIIYEKYLEFFLYALVYGIVIYLNKENYDSLPNPKIWEIGFGIAVIIIAFLSTSIKWIFFPETRVFGVFNYCLFIVGITLVFYPISKFKKIYGPMVLLGTLVLVNTVFSMRILTDFAETYISPSIASFTAWFLGIFYPSIYATGITIFTDNGPIEIVGACSGIHSIFFYGIIASALITTVESTIPRKIFCIFLGITGAFLTNIIRINILVISLVNGKIFFDFVHEWIGSALFLIFLGIYWWISFEHILVKSDNTKKPMRFNVHR